jgi:hypothetical protein
MAFAAASGRGPLSRGGIYRLLFLRGASLRQKICRRLAAIDRFELLFEVGGQKGALLAAWRLQRQVKPGEAEVAVGVAHAVAA